MGARAKAKRAAWALPPHERICIWCDGSAAEAKTREHVLAESLGGARDYRLMGGLVCDPCNRGTLQKIDEQMLLFGPLLWIRSQFALARNSQRIVPGMEFDHEQNEYRIDTAKLTNGNAATFDEVRGVITTRIAGPSSQARGEHMTRGLHRIAYNVLAHDRGGLFVRTRFRFLRELVLDLDAITPRAFVLDHTGVLPALQAEVTSRTKRRRTSQAHVVNGSDGEPDLVRIEIGPAAFFVSVRASTAPLATVVTGKPDRTVYGIIEHPA